MESKPNGGGEKMCSIHYQRKKPSLKRPKTLPQVGWSNMLPEVLDVIARKHIVFYEDYHSFAGVCKSWHTVALKAAKEAKGNGPPSRLPSLMLSEEVEDEKCRELYLLSNKTIREIWLPEVSGKLCMSSCGWLVTVADDHSSQLINPLSREIFELPKVDTFPRSDTITWYDSIKKLLFIAELSLVVVVWGCSAKLGYCRIGDKKWTPVDNVGSSIMDITYYNREVYLFNILYVIQVWDVHGEDPTKIVVLHSHVPADFYADNEEDLGISYILGLDDGERKRLLVVSRKGPIKDEGDYATKYFQVWDFDLENRELSKVSDLGNKTLFVGHSSSFWIEDTTGVIKGNCIYFTDDVVEAYRESQDGGGGDMGIYDLSDKYFIAPFFTGKSRSHLTPPIWVQSM